MTQIGRKEKKAILFALASALFARPLELPEDPDWDALFKECTSQAIFPLVYMAVRSGLPDGSRKKWNPQLLQMVASSTRISAAHAELHKLLTDHGIPYVILKGSASSGYYPKPELRTMGDVDFLVDPADLERCTKLLEGQGFRRRNEDLRHQWHIAFGYQLVEYELHWAPMGIPTVGGDRLRDYCRGLIPDAVSAQGPNGSYNVPSDFHHGLILLLHTVSHLTTTGIGLRHLCDWAVFVEKFSDEAFCDCFEVCLKEVGLWELAKVLTGMSVRCLGAAPKQWAADVPDALLDSLMQDIWDGGNFGSKDSQRISYTAVMIDGETLKVEERGVLSALMLAIHRKAKVYHPRMAASPVLLPAAWAAICCRYTWRILTGKRSLLKFGGGRRDRKAAQRAFQAAQAV